MDLYLAHHGIKGQKWGIRRYQNEDGSLTPAGRRRYRDELSQIKNKKEAKLSVARRMAKDIKRNPALLTEYNKAYENYHALSEEYDSTVKKFNKLRKQYAKEYYDSEIAFRPDEYKSTKEIDDLKDYADDYAYDKITEQHPEIKILSDNVSKASSQLRDSELKLANKYVGYFADKKIKNLVADSVFDAWMENKYGDWIDSLEKL